MKKIFLIVQKKDMENSLEALREFGVIHVEHQKTPSGEELGVLKQDIRNVENILTVLSDKTGQAEQEELEDWNAVVHKILRLSEDVGQLEDVISKRTSRIKIWEPWGSFNPEDIKNLEAKGVHIKLCEVNPKEKHEVPEGVIIEKIWSKGNLDRCVALADHDFGLPYDYVPAPSVGLNELKAAQKRDREALNDAKKNLSEATKYYESFKKISLKLQQDLKFKEVKEGMAVAEEFVCLKGYCPVDQSVDLENRAKQEQWAISIDEPSEEDQVPTLLRNPRWIQLIKPVFDMMNIVPGYKEPDISLYFLLFFCVFTAMLIGDAGYGLIFLGLVGFVHFKMGRTIRNKSALFLGYAGSLSVVVWGALSGTFFGQAWLPDFIQPIIPWLRETNNVILVCFIVGTLHLSIAHVWRAIMKFPSISFLGEMGLLSMIWALFFVVRYLILGAAFPAIAKGLFILAPILILFFTQPNKNILKAIGSGLGALLSSVLGSFPDIISYIRLFAVGLASVAVADAFNKMASDVGFSLKYGLLAVIVLLIGHVLNIILCAMAVLVHGVRLNVLEFACNHLSMEWSGTVFEPFKKD